MSELKAMKFFEAVPTSKEGFYQPGAFVDGYLKSEADKVIARHKYKQCLAMAKLAVKDDYAPWNMKWNKIWLALAEEPTWVKFLQLIHKEAK